MAAKFVKTLQKGQFVTLAGILRYRELEDKVKNTTFKRRVAEIHATSIKRLSKSKPPMIRRTEPTTSSRRLGWVSPRLIHLRTTLIIT